MKILNLVQGSPEWLAARARYFCASDAPAMMGASKHTKRSELVRMKATGAEKEFSDWQQKNLLEKGHGVEAGARAVVEEMIGTELYPVTGSDDTEQFLASFDGITMTGDTGFEHKLWNEDLAAAIRAKATEFPGGIEWQLEQQALIGKLKRIIFVCSDGTPDKLVWMEYRPVKGRTKELLDGWKQFDEDVANYKHVEVIPAAQGREIRDLPLLNIQLVGKVESSNLAYYRDTALAFIESINTSLTTDQDFADAEKTVKFCDSAEKQLEDVKKRALAQTASIADLFNTLDQLREAMRGKRLQLDKLVKTRKEDIRAEILRGGQTALAAHIAALNTRIGKPYMPTVPADFAGAMRGKKSIVSLRDAVDTELARAKIAANAIADTIGINLNVLRDLAAQHEFLFADIRELVLKDGDAFKALVMIRISTHKEDIRVRAEAATAAAAAARPQAPAPTPAQAASSAKVVPLREPQRPGDDKIIAALCEHFNVSPDTVIAWLRDMDLPQPATAAQGA